MSVFSWVIRVLVVVSFVAGICMFFYWKASIQEQLQGRKFTTTTSAPLILNYTASRLKVEADALHYKKCMEWFFWKDPNVTDKQFPDYYATSVPQCVKQLVFKTVVLIPHQIKEARLVHVYPIESDHEPSVFVEVGWTKEIEIEKQIRRRVTKDSAIYIADPQVPNYKNNWDNIATFFDITVTVGQETSNSAEQQSSPSTMDIIPFINQVVKLQVIDQLAVNSAATSSRMLPLLLKDGPFDKNNIVLCQLNFKINAKDYAQITPILKELTKEYRYIPLRILIKKDSIQMYLINVERHHCVDRYLSQYF